MGVGQGGAILDLTSMHDLGLSSFPIIVQVGLIWAQTEFHVQNRKKKMGRLMHADHFC